MWWWCGSVGGCGLCWCVLCAIGFFKSGSEMGKEDDDFFTTSILVGEVRRVPMGAGVRVGIGVEE